MHLLELLCAPGRPGTTTGVGIEVDRVQISVVGSAQGDFSQFGTEMLAILGLRARRAARSRVMGETYMGRFIGTWVRANMGSAPGTLGSMDTYLIHTSRRSTRVTQRLSRGEPERALHTGAPEAAEGMLYGKAERVSNGSVDVGQEGINYHAVSRQSTSPAF